MFAFITVQLSCMPFNLLRVRFMVEVRVKGYNRVFLLHFNNVCYGSIILDSSRKLHTSHIFG